MKRGWLVVCGLALATFALSMNGMAQENSGSSPLKERSYFSDVVTIQRADFKRLEKMYAAALTSENDGVVESSLAHVAVFKLVYPIKEFGFLQEGIETVAATHRSPVIRFRAALVSMLYANPEMFSKLARTTYDSPDELFDEMAQCFRQSLASN